MFLIVVKDVPLLDGEYEFPSDLTNRELRTIKQMSGVRAGEVEDAVNAGDNEFYIALTAIALKRAGKVFVEDMLWDAVSGAIAIVERKDEGDATGPPVLAPSPEPVEPSGTSGLSSSGSGAPSPETSSPSGSGTPDSAIGATSDPETSAGLHLAS